MSPNGVLRRLRSFGGMPPNGVLSRLGRSFEGYCYRRSQMLVIVNDSRTHWGTGSLRHFAPSLISVDACGGFHTPPNFCRSPNCVLCRLRIMWKASTVLQMPPNGVLRRLRSFEGYCNFWEAYRSFQMLVIVNDGGITLGDRVFEHFVPSRNSVEACGGFHRPPKCHQTAF